MASRRNFTAAWCQDLLCSSNRVRLSREDVKLLVPHNDLIQTDKLAEAWKDDFTVEDWRCVQSKRTPETLFAPEFSLLLSLGRGLNGRVDILHGGVFAAILDLTASLAAVKAAGPTARTTEINLYYRNHMPLPCEALCTATVTKIEAEHVWADVILEDGLGREYCRAEIKFIAKNKQNL